MDVCARSQRTENRNAVIVAEQKLDAGVDVFAMPMDMPLSLLRIAEALPASVSLMDTSFSDEIRDTVVLDVDDKLALRYICADNKRSALQLWFQPVMDRVFHKRLDQELGVLYTGGRPPRCG